MEVDRLKEIKGDDVAIEMDTKTDDNKSDEKKPSEINVHMKLYEPISKSLDKIKSNIGKVEKLKEKDRKTANEKERKDIVSDMEKVMSETNSHASQIKQKLEDIKKDDDAYAKDNKESAKLQVRTNLYQTNIRRFHNLMNQYNSVSQEFRQSLQDRTRRQLKIVNKDISEEQVEKILEDGNASKVIQGALISDDLQDVVQDIEDRHLDILRLEKQVQEVFELFRDLAALVDLQQESLDVIETRITNAKNYTEKAEVQLKDAEVYQQKSRKRQCIILLIVIVVLTVVLAPTLTKVLGSS